MVSYQEEEDSPQEEMVYQEEEGNSQEEEEYEVVCRVGLRGLRVVGRRGGIPTPPWSD